MGKRLTHTFRWLNSDVLNEHWQDSEVSILPIYKELIAAGLRIWVFRYSLISNQLYNMQQLKL